MSLRKAHQESRRCVPPIKASSHKAIWTDTPSVKQKTSHGRASPQDLAQKPIPQHASKLPNLAVLEVKTCCTAGKEGMYKEGSCAPAIQAIGADVKDHHVQQLRLGVEEEGQHILLIQPHLVRGQVRPQVLHTPTAFFSAASKQNSKCQVRNAPKLSLKKGKMSLTY